LEVIVSFLAIFVFVQNLKPSYRVKFAVAKFTSWRIIIIFFWGTRLRLSPQ